jgi:hypothetical protein
MPEPTTETYIVVLHRIGPTSHFGPFETYEDAEKWNQTDLKGSGFVVELYHPEQKSKPFREVDYDRPLKGKA